MHVRCPNCQIGLDVVQDRELQDLSCPSCGNSLNELFTADATKTYTVEDGSGYVAHFKRIDRLGGGTFGVVWKAHDTQLDRFVAIKVPRSGEYDQASLDQFLREAQAAAQIRHPNIVTVYEVGRANGGIYIASELINGVSLRERLQDRSYSAREAAEMAAVMADALNAAHEAGIVHRDMKPGNVLIDGDEQPHITDFGLAKRETAEMTITMAGQVLGTAAYMSPEQARGDSHSADRRSDVYSLGVILYELLCGKKPFMATKSRQLMHQVQFDEPPPPRKHDKKIPRDLETICLKAMRKEPDRRYPTAQAMADDLRRYLRGEPIQARPVSIVERAVRWCRRNPLVAASSSVAVAALLTLGAVASRPAPPPSGPQPVQVRLATVPPGATVVFHPLDPQTGEPQPERSVRAAGTSPVEVELPPGDYLVVAVSADEKSFHEVFRRVPGEGQASGAYKHSRWAIRSDGRVELPEVELPSPEVAEGMVAIEGAADFMIGADDQPTVPTHRRSIPGFLLDDGEMTIAEYRGDLEVVRAFSHYKSNGVAIDDAEPIAFVSWDEATQRAEALGKRLPDEFEYEFAATSAGKSRFPWGDEVPTINEWPIQRVAEPTSDQTSTSPPLRGLYSNVPEWTSSWAAPYPAHRNEILLKASNAVNSRIVRGAPFGVIAGNFTSAEMSTASPRQRISQLTRTWSRQIGFRCARSLKPRLEPADFGLELKVSARTSGRDLH